MGSRGTLARQDAETDRQRYWKVRLRLRLRKKESDLRSTLTSTSAYLLAAALLGTRRVSARQG